MQKKGFCGITNFFWLPFPHILLAKMLKFYNTMYSDPNTGGRPQMMVSKGLRGENSNLNYY